MIEIHMYSIQVSHSSEELPHDVMAAQAHCKEEASIGAAFCSSIDSLL